MSGRVCTQMRLRIFMGTKSHKEGPATVGGSLMVLRPVIKNLRYSEKSHKEGPTAGGRIPYGLASGNKKFTVQRKIS